ncbi:hypothetical protein ECHHL_1010 [Ehrlichia chaffeensis str. Heartland]|uniref:Uncharacterized protein n=1 Tax=Ehrlichia chaffeensis (strain ATCC CRL-10679 / Arkansas) TaxID=205920 RepID=Q2GI55_EHRCR|nr:hypothetical protein ECH_0047 [Ehrlichia chaffeensis str. Arkansas]AHX04135.1 hypothetical protein ECHHL_1010 [Ehrlichia chaffeensis str. Heartland]AHX07166.1 hypothetical protein ECHOSC_1025 [Ehrlichia chaffeensis str. Osceola]
MLIIIEIRFIVKEFIMSIDWSHYFNIVNIIHVMNFNIGHMGNVNMIK